MLQMARPLLKVPATFARASARSAAVVAGGTVHAANAPSHVAGSSVPFAELKKKPMTHTRHLGRDRAINLAAGAAALPLEVLELRKQVEKHSNDLGNATRTITELRTKVTELENKLISNNKELHAAQDLNQALQHEYKETIDRKSVV